MPHGVSPPEQLAIVVATSLAKKPDARYQDGDAFAQALREAAVAFGGPPMAPAPASTDPDKTMAFSLAAAAQAQATAEKTLVMAAGAAAANGYDAPPKGGGAGGGEYEKTAVFGRNDDPTKPGGGHDPQA